MGLLSMLGKVGAGIAAPFTGGASLAFLPAIDAIGGALSGAAKGSADQRIAEAPALIGAQNSNLAGARDAFSAGLSGQQFNASEQDRALRRQILASLLGGVGDVSISRPAGSTIPTFGISGGLRPSALGNKEALMASMNQPTMTAPTYQGPKPLDLPQAGMLEKVLGGVGMGAGILGALGRARKPTSYGTPPFVPGGLSMPMPGPR